MVVCYDAHASPIRDMQRCGRTGRHRGGRVVQLLALGKEEASYTKQQMVRSTYNLQELEKYVLAAESQSRLHCLGLLRAAISEHLHASKHAAAASYDAALLHVHLLGPSV